MDFYMSTWQTKALTLSLSEKSKVIYIYIYVHKYIILYDLYQKECSIKRVLT